MSVLLTVGGQNYFIDFANIEKVLSSGNSGGFKGGMITETEINETYEEGKEMPSTKVVITRTFHKSKEVDGFRYETIRNMIDILLTTEDVEDLKGGLGSQPISFKIAFNTLIEYGILNIAE